MAKPFLTTSDKETIDKLIALGFQVASKSGNRWVFINQSEAYNALDPDVKKHTAKTDSLFL